MTLLPPLPKLGVSAACLRAFQEGHAEFFLTGGTEPSGEKDANGNAIFVKNGKAATTTDVCLGLVKELTAGARTSLALCLLEVGAKDANGVPFVAEATVFLSHAWRYYAKDSFAAMEAYAQRQDHETYFWYDIFTNDQHDALKLPQLWWRDAFMMGVKHIGHTLLLLSPWHDPAPLKRAWCLWEILSTVRTEAKLTVNLPPGDDADFELSLKDDFPKIAGAISNIDMRGSEAYMPKDKEMIIAAVHATVGFSDLNSLVCARMREWLTEQGRAALDRLPESERYASKLARNLIRLLQDQDELEAAEVLGRASCEAYLELKAEDAETFLAMSTLARVLKKRGGHRYQEAATLFKTADTGLTKLLQEKKTTPEMKALVEEAKDPVMVMLITGEGDAEALAALASLAGDATPREGAPSPADAADAGLSPEQQRAKDEYTELFKNSLIVQNNLADFYSELEGKQEESEALFVEILAKQRMLLGNNDTSTLTTANNLAMSYTRRGANAEAEPLMKMVYEARVKNPSLGERHQDTLLALNNFASVLKALGKFAESEKCYRKALAHRREIMGPAAKATLNSMNNLAVVIVAQAEAAETLGDEEQAAEKYDEAGKLLAEAYEGLKLAYGATHKDTISMFNNYTVMMFNHGQQEKAIQTARALLEECKEGAKEADSAQRRSMTEQTRWSTEDAAEPVEYASEKDLKKIANHLHNLLVGTQEDSYVEEAEQLKADNPQLFA